MEKNIVEKIETLISTKFPDNNQINGFIKANEEYQKLIQEGLTIKRGYNILTTEEIYILNSQYTCNQK